MKKIWIISLFTVLVGCVVDSRRVRPEERTARNAVESAVPLDALPVVNVYIENSGSMDGYVRGRTEFKGAIRDMLVLLKYHYAEDSIRLYFVNNEIHPLRKAGQTGSSSDNQTISTDLVSYARDLEMNWREGQEKSLWQSTNLNKIFKQILRQTDNRTISILFSDCIYSIPGTNPSQTRGMLQDEKSLTKDAFLSKWKNDQVPLATTIVKMNSHYDGKYYPYTGDDKSYVIQGERPYYICVIANQALLSDFNRKVELKADKVEGYENKYTLLSEAAGNIYYSVLQSSMNKGRFKPDRGRSKSTYIRGITDVNLVRGVERLQFAVAADFHGIHVENDYLCRPSNYTVLSNNFSIQSVTPIDSVSISAGDKKRIADGHPTHVIVLEAKTRLVSDVSFVLNKRLPQWIAASHTEDDTSESKTRGKTFGLYYWVTGIAEAYATMYPQHSHFFECTVTIR